MRGKMLQVEHLRARLFQVGEQAAFPRPGQAADDEPAKWLHEFRQIVDHGAAEGFVATFQLSRIPSDFTQNVGERAAALTAAPAVHQWAPRARLILQFRLEMARDIGGHERRACFPGAERRDLLVERSHASPLFIREYRQISRTWNVVECELGRSAHVHDLVKLG